MKTIPTPSRLAVWAACLLLSVHVHLATAQTALRLPPGVERITSVEDLCITHIFFRV